MSSEFSRSITVLRLTLKDFGFTEEQEKAVNFAIDKLREMQFDQEEKKRNLQAICNLYKFNPHKEIVGEDMAYNRAVRDVLQIIDPLQTRYKEGFEDAGE